MAFRESIWLIPGIEARFLVQLADVRTNENLTDLICPLEDMYYGSVTYPESGGGLDVTPTGRTHQMVVVARDGDDGDIDPEIVSRLIYRVDLPSRPEFSIIDRPVESNRNVGAGAAVGPFVSVLWGQQDYVENMAFMSSLMACASSSVLAAKRRELLIEILKLDATSPIGGLGSSHRKDIARRRSTLDQVSRLIAETERSVAVSVDGLSSVMSYVPSLRVESYHRALYTSLNIDRDRAAIDDLTRHLRTMVASQREVLDSLVQTMQEERTRRWTLTVGIASALAIPFGIIFGFFGMSAAEVRPAESMFSPAYAPLYTVVLLLTLAIAIVHFTLFLRHRSRVRSRERPGAERGGSS